MAITNCRNMLLTLLLVFGSAWSVPNRDTFSSRLNKEARELDMQQTETLKIADEDNLAGKVQLVLAELRPRGAVADTAPVMLQGELEGQHTRGSRPSQPNWEIPPIDESLSWEAIANMLRYKPVIKSLKDTMFFQERFRRELDAWRDAIMYVNMKMKQDIETKPQFVPGVGYLRPFIRYPNFIKPDAEAGGPAGLFTAETLEKAKQAAMKAAKAA